MIRRAMCMLLSAAGLMLLTALVSAQTAPTVRITAVVLSVEHRVGPTGQWSRSRVGTLLPAGSRVRTGKRSKCEVRFPDGSVIRMGPTSDMVIHGVNDRNMQLRQGTLFARFVSGSGARIQGGSAVAAVKGTTLDYSSMPNPDDTFTDNCNVYETDDGVDFETPGGTTPLMGGFGAFWSPGLPPGPPPPNPQPPQQFGHGQYSTPWGGYGSGGNQQSTPGGDGGLNLAQGNYSAGSAVNALLPGTYGTAEGDLAVVVQSASSTARRTTPAGMLAMAQMPRMAASFIGATVAQTPVSREFLGRRFFGPYLHTDVFGVWGETDSAAGLRVRPTAVVGDWYVELGGTTWYDFDGNWRTRLTEAFAAIRPQDSEITIGRQHFLQGPVNNSDLGTVIGFDTIDAVRYQRQIDGRWRADLALVHDFLPLSGPDLRGCVARVEANFGGGMFGLNWVRERGRGTAKSLDFSVPALPGLLDVYGEFGSNSAGKHVETWGIYLPALYQKHDIDLFVERASRRGEPTLNSLVAYKQVTDDVTAVLLMHKSSGESWRFAVGGMWDF